MKITHVDGVTVDTDTLSDIDALLMEESKKLHELYAKYNRQLFLVGEMKNHPDSTAKQGGVFFHVADESSPEPVIVDAWNSFYWRLNCFIEKMSNGHLFIGRR